MIKTLLNFCLILYLACKSYELNDKVELNSIFLFAEGKGGQKVRGSVVRDDKKKNAIGVLF